MLTPTYLTTNQSKQCPQADHALFEPFIKLLTTPSRWGHTGLRALVRYGPLCLAKQ